MKSKLIITLSIAILIGAFASLSKAQDKTSYPYIILGGGCFWCLESEMSPLPGVVETIAGYSGGNVENPEYYDVTSGKSGHAEVVKIIYDPAMTSRESLLHYFLTTAHNPTTLNQQWVDKGTQYRSVIFYKNDEDKKLAKSIIDKVDASGAWKNKIVTTLEPEATFWPAEEYHQDYYKKYQARAGEKHIRQITKPKYGKNKK